MMYAKQTLEKHIAQGVKEGKGSKQARSVTARGAMKRNRSLLSMDNLDIDEDGDSASEGASDEDSDGNKSASGQKAGSGNESGDSAKQRGKRQRGNFTERTARVESMA